MVKVLTIICAMLLVFSQPRSPRSPVNVSALGPQIGSRVPDFDLQDQNGRKWSLSSIMGPKGAMLVFYRSADW